MHGEEVLPVKPSASPTSSSPSLLLILLQLLAMTAVAEVLYVTDTALLPSLALLSVLLGGSIVFTVRSYRSAQPTGALPCTPLSSPPTTAQENQGTVSPLPARQRTTPTVAAGSRHTDHRPFDLTTSHAIDFNLRTTVEETIARFASIAKNKGVELSCLFSSDSPTPFRGDPGDIRLILMNLIDYTLTSITEGEILIRATLTQQTATHATFRFSLSATSPTTSLPLTPDPQQEGGIAISKQLVKTFGGQLEIERAPDASPTLWFTLTLEKQAPKSVADPAPCTNLSGRRVLLVSDSFSLLDEDVATWGLAERHTVRSSHAWPMITTAAQTGHPYDVVLLHCQELNDDTLDLAARVRATEARATLRLVFITHTGQKGDARRIRQAGFDAYLTFPVSPPLLFECLTAVLGQPPQPLAPDLPLVTRYTLAEARMRGRARILIVDSTLADQKHAVRLVEELGYRADIAITAREAIEAHARLPYTAILLPAQMVGIDGIAAATQIRQHDRREGRHTPLIGVLQSQSDSERAQCLAAGMDLVVNKPLLLESVKATIDRCCRSTAEPHVAIAASPTGRTETGAVNLHEALARIDGDKELFDEMATLFFEEYPKSLARMHEAVTRHDPQSLVYSANALKGSLGNFAATKAIDATQGLELMGRQGDLSHALPALAALEKHLAHVHALLADFQRQVAA